MSTELTAYHDYAMPQRSAYAELLAQAADLIPSGLWSRGQGVLPAPSPGKIFLAMETGDMLGLHPIAALQGIHVIEGKATMSAALMQAVIRSKGHRLRVKVTGTAEGGDLAATATLTRSDDAEFEYSATWTPQRAVRATLLDSYDEKDGKYQAIATSREGKPLAWQKSLEALLKARAISEVCREGAEDALLGVHYTPEELGAQITDAGEYVEGEAANVSSMPTEPEAQQVQLAQTAKPARKRPTKGAQGVKVADVPTSPVEAPEAASEPQSAADAILGADPPDLPTPPVTRDDTKGDMEGTTPADDLGVIHYDGQTGEVVEPVAQPEPEVTKAEQEAIDAKIIADRKARGARTAEHVEATKTMQADHDPALRVGTAENTPEGDEPWGDPEPAENEAEWALLAEVDQAKRAYQHLIQNAPGDWPKLLKTATTVEQVKDVWDRAGAAGELTSELKAEVSQHKTRVIALQAELAAGPVTDGLV